MACGAISGFHASQSPIVSRCIENEKDTRPVFYGAMVLEGLVALCWQLLQWHFSMVNHNLQSFMVHHLPLRYMEWQLHL
ncbi:carbon starvation CstA family protein [Methanobrevibacter sp.]